MAVLAFRAVCMLLGAVGKSALVRQTFFCFAKPMKALLIPLIVLRMPLVILAQERTKSCARPPTFLRKESGGGREGGKGFAFLCQNDTCAVFSVLCHVVVTPSSFFLVSA